VHIRVADIRDVQCVDTLLKRSYPVLMKHAYAPEILAAALPPMTRANPDLIVSGSYYIVEQDEAIIGCGGWTNRAPGTGVTTGGLVHARHFAVDPDCAGSGVGRAVFERCATDAGVTGATRIQAMSSLNAVPFYERMGLQRFSLIELPFGPGAGFCAVLMEGPLKI